MRTVAAGAIDHLGRAASRRLAVIAVGERLDRVGGHAVFLRHMARGVARGADLLGHVARINR